MSKTRIDMRVIEKIAADELDGTGLECVVIVYRPGFVDRGDPVAIGTRGKNLREVSDALLAAADQMTERMKEALE